MTTAGAAFLTTGAKDRRTCAGLCGAILGARVGDGRAAEQRKHHSERETDQIEPPGRFVSGADIVGAPRAGKARPASHLPIQPRFAQFRVSPSPRSGEGGRRPDGVRKAGMARRRFAVTVVQSDCGLSSGPHPIRRHSPSKDGRLSTPYGATFPSKLGKGPARQFQMCECRSPQEREDRCPSILLAAPLPADRRAAPPSIARMASSPGASL